MATLADQSLGFQWDEAKRQANLTIHGIDFVEIVQIFFFERYVDVPSPRNDEPRRKVTGMIDGKFFTAVYVMRDGYTRLISARRAHPDEERAYRQLYNG